MYFAGQNLLYTFHRSLTPRHVTVGMFKRYAQSPENRTFKNYFRKTEPFTKYMHQRPQNSLGRYITKHRRKKNPILAHFTDRIATTIMETLQNLRQSYPAPTGRNMEGMASDLGRCPGLNDTAPSVRQQVGLKGRGIIAQPIGLGLDAPTYPNRPEGAAYSSSNNLGQPLCPPRQDQISQNKPIFKPGKITLSRYREKTKGKKQKTAGGKTNPMINKESGREELTISKNFMITTNNPLQVLNNY